MDNFNLENQYQIFLQKIGLDENEIPSQQKKQLKLIFMVACRQILILLRDEVSLLDDDEGVKVMKGIIDQAKDFILKYIQ